MRSSPLYSTELHSVYMVHYYPALLDNPGKQTNKKNYHLVEGMGTFTLDYLKGKPDGAYIPTDTCSVLGSGVGAENKDDLLTQETKQTVMCYNRGVSKESRKYKGGKS